MKVTAIRKLRVTVTVVVAQVVKRITLNLITIAPPERRTMFVSVDGKQRLVLVLLRLPLQILLKPQLAVILVYV
jgi:hypothetical protein